MRSVVEVKKVNRNNANRFNLFSFAMKLLIPVIVVLMSLTQLFVPFNVEAQRNTLSTDSIEKIDINNKQGTGTVVEVGTWQELKDLGTEVDGVWVISGNYTIKLTNDIAACAPIKITGDGDVHISADSDHTIYRLKGNADFTVFTVDNGGTLTLGDHVFMSGDIAETYQKKYKITVTDGYGTTIYETTVFDDETRTPLQILTEQGISDESVEGKAGATALIKSKTENDPDSPYSLGYKFKSWDMADQRGKPMKNVAGDLLITAQWDNPDKNKKLYVVDGYGNEIYSVEVEPNSSKTARQLMHEATINGVTYNIENNNSDIETVLDMKLGSVADGPKALGYTWKNWNFNNLGMQPFSSHPGDFYVVAEWNVPHYTITLTDGYGRVVKTISVQANDHRKPIEILDAEGLSDENDAGKTNIYNLMGQVTGSDPGSPYSLGYTLRETRPWDMAGQRDNHMDTQIQGDLLIKALWVAPEKNLNLRVTDGAGNTIFTSTDKSKTIQQLMADKGLNANAGNQSASEKTAIANKIGSSAESPANDTNYSFNSWDFGGVDKTKTLAQIDGNVVVCAKWNEPSEIEYVWEVPNPIEEGMEIEMGLANRFIGINPSDQTEWYNDFGSDNKKWVIANVQGNTFEIVNKSDSSKKMWVKSSASNAGQASSEGVFWYSTGAFAQTDIYTRFYFVTNGDTTYLACDGVFQHYNQEKRAKTVYLMDNPLANGVFFGDNTSKGVAIHVGKPTKKYDNPDTPGKTDVPGAGTPTGTPDTPGVTPATKPVHHDDGQQNAGRHDTSTGSVPQTTKTKDKAKVTPVSSAASPCEMPVKPGTVRDALYHKTRSDDNDSVRREKFSSANKGFFVKVNQGGTFDLEGATLHHFDTVNYKDNMPTGVAPVYVEGNFNMSSGAIKDNKVSYSVVNSSGNIAEINDPQFIDNGALNTVSDMAGGSGDRNGGYQVIDRATNYNKRSQNSAGAVIIEGGTTNISGGTISGNYSHAGAISIGSKDSNNKATVNFTGGTIDDNVGSKNGTVMVGPDTTLNMSGTAMLSNNTNWFGGAVHVTSAGSNESDAQGVFNLNGLQAKIFHNEARTTGGGITVYSNRVNLVAGTINENKSHVFGGGIYVYGLDNPYGSISPLSFTLVLDYVGVHDNVATFSGKNDAAMNNSGHIESSESDKFFFADYQRTIDGKSVGVSDSRINYADNLQRFTSGSGGGLWLCPQGAVEISTDTVHLIYNEADVHGDDLFKDNGFGGGYIVSIDNDPEHHHNWYHDWALHASNGQKIDPNNNTNDYMLLHLDRALVDQADGYYMDNDNNIHSNGTKDGKITPTELRLWYETHKDDPIVSANVRDNYQTSYGLLTDIESTYGYRGALALTNHFNRDGTPNSCKDYDDQVYGSSPLQIYDNVSRRGGGIGADGNVAFIDRNGDQDREFNYAELTFTKTFDGVIESAMDYKLFVPTDTETEEVVINDGKVYEKDDTLHLNPLTDYFVKNGQLYKAAESFRLYDEEWALANNANTADNVPDEGDKLTADEITALGLRIVNNVVLDSDDEIAIGYYAYGGNIYRGDVGSLLDSVIILKNSKTNKYDTAKVIIPIGSLKVKNKSTGEVSSILKKSGKKVIVNTDFFNEVNNTLSLKPEYEWVNEYLIREYDKNGNIMGENVFHINDISLEKHERTYNNIKIGENQLQGGDGEYYTKDVYYRLITNTFQFEQTAENSEKTTEKYINNKVHRSLVSFDEHFEYSIMAYVPENATEVIIEDTLQEPLMFVDASGTEQFFAYGSKPQYNVVTNGIDYWVVVEEDEPGIEKGYYVIEKPVSKDSNNIIQKVIAISDTKWSDPGYDKPRNLNDYGTFKNGVSTSNTSRYVNNSSGTGYDLVIVDDNNHKGDGTGTVASHSDKQYFSDNTNRNRHLNGPITNANAIKIGRYNEKGEFVEDPTGDTIRVVINNDMLTGTGNQIDAHGKWIILSFDAAIKPEYRSLEKLQEYGWVDDFYNKKGTLPAAEEVKAVNELIEAVGIDNVEKVVEYENAAYGKQYYALVKENGTDVYYVRAAEGDGRWYKVGVDGGNENYLSTDGIKRGAWVSTTATDTFDKPLSDLNNAEAVFTNQNYIDIPAPLLLPLDEYLAANNDYVVSARRSTDEFDGIDRFFAKSNKGELYQMVVGGDGYWYKTEVHPTETNWSRFGKVNGTTLNPNNIGKFSGGTGHENDGSGKLLLGANRTNWVFTQNKGNELNLNELRSYYEEVGYNWPVILGVEPHAGEMNEGHYTVTYPSGAKYRYKTNVVTFDVIQPEKYVNGKIHEILGANDDYGYFDSMVEYTIQVYVPEDAEEVQIYDTLRDDMMFVDYLGNTQYKTYSIGTDDGNGGLVDSDVYNDAFTPNIPLGTDQNRMITNQTTVTENGVVKATNIYYLLIKDTNDHKGDGTGTAANRTSGDHLNEPIAGTNGSYIRVGNLTTKQDGSVSVEPNNEGKTLLIHITKETLDAYDTAHNSNPSKKRIRGNWIQATFRAQIKPGSYKDIVNKISSENMYTTDQTLIDPNYPNPVGYYYRTSEKTLYKENAVSPATPTSNVYYIKDANGQFTDRRTGAYPTTRQDGTPTVEGVDYRLEYECDYVYFVSKASDLPSGINPNNTNLVKPVYVKNGWNASDAGISWEYVTDDGYVIDGEKLYGQSSEADKPIGVQENGDHAGLANKANYNVKRDNTWNSNITNTVTVVPKERDIQVTKIWIVKPDTVLPSAEEFLNHIHLWWEYDDTNSGLHNKQVGEITDLYRNNMSVIFDKMEVHGETVRYEWKIQVKDLPQLSTNMHYFLTEDYFEGYNLPEYSQDGHAHHNGRIKNDLEDNVEKTHLTVEKDWDDGTTNNNHTETIRVRLLGNNRIIYQRDSDNKLVLDDNNNPIEWEYSIKELKNTDNYEYEWSELPRFKYDDVTGDPLFIKEGYTLDDYHKAIDGDKFSKVSDKWVVDNQNGHVLTDTEIAEMLTTDQNLAVKDNNQAIHADIRYSIELLSDPEGYILTEENKIRKIYRTQETIYLFDENNKKEITKAFLYGDYTDVTNPIYDSTTIELNAEQLAALNETNLDGCRIDQDGRYTELPHTPNKYYMCFYDEVDSYDAYQVRLVNTKPQIEKYINKDVHLVTHYTSDLTYDIMAYIPEEATEIEITDELLPTLILKSILEPDINNNLIVGYEEHLVNNLPQTINVAIRSSNNHTINGDVASNETDGSAVGTLSVTGNTIKLKIENIYPATNPNGNYIKDENGEYVRVVNIENRSDVRTVKLSEIPEGYALLETQRYRLANENDQGIGGKYVQLSFNAKLNPDKEEALKEWVETAGSSKNPNADVDWDVIQVETNKGWDKYIKDTLGISEDTEYISVPTANITKLIKNGDKYNGDKYYAATDGTNYYVYPMNLTRDTSFNNKWWRIDAGGPKYYDLSGNLVKSDGPLDGNQDYWFDGQPTFIKPMVDSGKNVWVPIVVEDTYYKETGTPDKYYLDWVVEEYAGENKDSIKANGLYKKVDWGRGDGDINRENTLKPSKYTGDHAGIVNTASYEVTYGNRYKSTHKSNTVTAVLEVYELPSSGGIGTYIFNLLGAMFISLGIMLFLGKRKKRLSN